MLSFKMIMIRFIFVVVLVSHFFSLHGQVPNRIDYAKYRCAYNYVKKNTAAKKIKVSRCIVDLSRWEFSIDSLEDYPEDKKALMASVEQINKERNEDFFSDEIATLTSDVKRPQNILFFSPVADNMLVACLLSFDRRRHRKRDIDKFDVISRFNESEEFLFIFDEDNKIKKVIKAFIRYD